MQEKKETNDPREERRMNYPKCGGHDVLIGCATREGKIYLWLARKIPRRFLYWIAIRIWAVVTTGKFGDTNASKITLIEALRRLDGNNKKT